MLKANTQSLTYQSNFARIVGSKFLFFLMNSFTHADGLESNNAIDLYELPHGAFSTRTNIRSSCADALQQLNFARSELKFDPKRPRLPFETISGWSCAHDESQAAGECNRRLPVRFAGRPKI